MQIATLNYPSDSKDNLNHETRTKQRHRHMLTSLVQPSRKNKHRPSFLSDPCITSNAPLPPIASNGKRPSSIRIKGSSLTAPKPSETSAYAFRNRSRSHSRHSDQSETTIDRRSRSISPGGPIRPSSRFVRLKFGYPITLRSAEFYGPARSVEDLHTREASFVNDSIRSAHQSRRQSIIPPYEPMTDPHLRRFFQSPVVLDVVRKTMNIDQSQSYKSDEHSSSISKATRHAITNDSSDYRRIVTKGSSGYGRLNGYDCIPLSSPARNYLNRSSALDGSTSNLAHRTSTDSHIHRSTAAPDKTQASANTSVNSFPTRSSYQGTDPEKKKTMRKYDRFKPPKPIATSSPLRNPIRQLVEQTPTIPAKSAARTSVPTLTTTQTNEEHQNSEDIGQSNQSQD